MTFPTALRESVLLMAVLVLGTAGQAVPTAPDDPKAVPKGPGRIDVSWTDLSSDETGFRIERSREGGAYSVLAEAGPDETNYSDTAFTPGADDRVLFSYRVSAFDGSGASAPTADASAVTVFAGEPLYGWLVVTDFGAMPDDGVDDTAAIQTAFDALGGFFGDPSPHVLYFPQGVYRISAPLLLEAHQSIQLVGDRSGDTVILWDPSTPICKRETGTAFVPLDLIEPTQYDPSNPPAPLYEGDDTLAMIHVDGSPLSTYRNLTWDANCTATCGSLDSCRIVAFDQSYCGDTDTNVYQTGCTAIVGYDPSVTLSKTEGFADSGTTHIDNVYRDAFVGLRIGHYGVQDSEITVRRSRFEDNHAGISIEDANALQTSVFHSAFAGNRYGITNAYLKEDLTSSAACAQPQGFFLEGGNVNVYRSNFSNSSRTDVFLGRENNFTFFDIRSLGSFRFLSMPCKRGATNTVSIARSRIELGSQPGPDTEGVAIWQRNAGPLFLFDNVIDNSAQGANPAVFADTFADAGVLSVASYYTANPVFGGNENEIVSIAEPPPPPTPPVTLHALPNPVDFLAGRDVYTAVDAATLRDVVYAALAEPGGAAVHVPSGLFPVDETIVIPDGSDLVILGDSEGSELTWEGPSAVTLLDVDGDAVDRVVLRDLHLDKGTASFVGVRVSGLDTPAQDREVVVAKLVAPNVESTEAIVLDAADGARIDFTDSGAGGVNTLNPRVTSAFFVRAGEGPQRPKSFWSSNVGHALWSFNLDAGAQGLDVVMMGGRSERVTHELQVTGGSGNVVSYSNLTGAHMTTELDAFRADRYSGTLSVVNSVSSDSDADFGALIVDSGSESASIRSMGNSFSCGGGSDCLQTDNQVTGATFDRRMVKVFCGTDADRNEDCVGVLPTGKGFRTVADEGSASDESLVNGLAPLSQPEVPFLYDGEGATAQLYLDHLRVGRPWAALRLEGAVAALLRERFETTPVGGDPPGWLDTGPNSSLSPKDRFEVLLVDGALAFGTQSNNPDIHSHFERPAGASAQWTAYEYGGRMRIAQAGASIGATALSQYDAASPQDAYYRLGRSGGEAFHLDVHPAAGEPLGCVDDTTTVDPQPGAWYRFCIQVIPGSLETRVRAKVWAQEVNEPARFAIDCDDTRVSRLDEGTTGIWSDSQGARFWDDLEVRALDPALPPPEGCLTAAP